MVSETISTSVGIFLLVQRECGGSIAVHYRDGSQLRFIGSRRTWERAEDFAYHYGQEVAS